MGLFDRFKKKKKDKNEANQENNKELEIIKTILQDNGNSLSSVELPEEKKFIIMSIIGYKDIKNIPEADSFETIKYLMAYLKKNNLSNIEVYSYMDIDETFDYILNEFISKYDLDKYHISGMVEAYYYFYNNYKMKYELGIINEEEFTSSIKEYRDYFIDCLSNLVEQRKKSLEKSKYPSDHPIFKSIEQLFEVIKEMKRINDLTNEELFFNTIAYLKSRIKTNDEKTKKELELAIIKLREEFFNRKKENKRNIDDRLKEIIMEANSIEEIYLDIKIKMPELRQELIDETISFIIKKKKEMNIPFNHNEEDTTIDQEKMKEIYIKKYQKALINMISSNVYILINQDKKDNKFKILSNGPIDPSLLEGYIVSTNLRYGSDQTITAKQSIGIEYLDGTYIELATVYYTLTNKDTIAFFNSSKEEMDQDEIEIKEIDEQIKQTTPYNGHRFDKILKRENNNKKYCLKRDGFPILPYDYFMLCFEEDERKKEKSQNRTIYIINSLKEKLEEIKSRKEARTNNKGKVNYLIQVINLIELYKSELSDIDDETLKKIEEFKTLLLDIHHYTEDNIEQKTETKFIIDEDFVSFLSVLTDSKGNLLNQDTLKKIIHKYRPEITEEEVEKYVQLALQVSATDIEIAYKDDKAKKEKK
ncbi:MAG: hypothetical protein IKF36_01250 [Bacilli bacterium]|nr:hypothetical protein [Bacilli bacterium]